MNDLTHILGGIDACFAPIRDYRRGHLSVNAMLAREGYAEAGIEWHGGGGSTSERKQIERRLSALEETGVVKLFRRKGRTARVKMTEAGEHEARLACGLPGMAESMHMASKLAEHQSREPDVMNQKWIPETVLAGVPWGGSSKPFALLEDVMLPALVAGLVEWGTTILRHCYYSLTEAGWLAVDAGIPAFDGKERAVGDHYDGYLESFADARQRMADADAGRTGEIGVIPLPVSMAGVPILGRAAKAEAVPA